MKGIQCVMNLFNRNPIKHINLSNNQIENEGTQIIAEILQTNIVKHNDFLYNLFLY